MAKTGQEVLNSLYNYAIYYGLITSRFEQGRTGLLFSVLASEITEWETIIENFEAQYTLVTATEEAAIQNIAAPLYQRQYATSAKIILTFTRSGANTDSDIKIPMNTIVETAGMNPIQFSTIEDAWIYHGGTSTEVLAFAVEPGTDSMVFTGELSVVSSEVAGVTVNNKTGSWGGVDDESIDVVRQKALQVRYELERCTTYSMRIALAEYGLTPPEYNIVEYEFGFGTVGIYIDTTIENVIDEVEDITNREKAAGIYVVCNMATPVSLNFSFAIELSTEDNLPPNQRDSLMADVKKSFEYYIANNGVGQDLIIHALITQLYRDLVDNYQISDIEVTSNAYQDRIDESGNIAVENFEVLKIDTISFDITVA